MQTDDETKTRADASTIEKTDGLPNCDIVMKGGVTSGVVYPSAVVELAKRFRFRNVGGTSAGAIAAVLTAAAERSRALGSNAGFEKLALVPEELSENDLLYRLFAPNRDTAPLFKTIVALLGRPKFKPGFLAKACSVFAAYPLATAVGTLPGIAALFVLRREPAGKWFALGTGIATVVISDTIAITRDLILRLPKNYYGLVTGLADTAAGVALNSWLEAKIEALGGLESAQVPLTFGMLWNPAAGAVATGLDEPPAERAINLEMISTNVTLGRPYRWPTKTSGLYYKPCELGRFFPPHVMQWLEDHPRVALHESPKDRANHKRFGDEGYRPLPPISDLPVIVATRMSLAFPVLLSAVPLYRVDHSRQSTEPPKLERCWFSDGGLSSNFPITLFDSPLPRWPTFAINLRPFPKTKAASEDEDDNVYMVGSNNAGQLPEWTRFDGVTGFFGALFNAMQNWNDSTQIVLPGYRDRIVTVFLSADEGGLNLDMPSALLKRLAKRGASAGRMLAARFADPGPGFPPSDKPNMNWTNHRWLRYRTTMGALRTYLAAFAVAYAERLLDPSYRALILGAAQLEVPSYPLPDSTIAAIEQITMDLVNSGSVLATQAAIEEHLPKPIPQLGIRATLDA